MFTRADNLILFFNPLPADPQSAQPHTYPPQTLGSNDPTLKPKNLLPVLLMQRWLLFTA